MMLETWKEATDNNKAFGALLTDLSEGFNCLSHDLLIAKFHAYDLDLASLKILQDYLTNRKQRTKVDSFYSSWERYYQVYHKVLYQVLFYLTHLCVTCF